MTLMLAFFQETASKTPGWFNIVPFLVLLLVMYFVVLRPQMKQNKERTKMVDSLQKGQKVITNGGIWGEIDAVEANFVKLKINDKSKIVVSRGSIAGLQPKPTEK